MIIFFGFFGNQSENFVIPAGADYYYYFEAPSSAAGHITGDFSVGTGTVDMYVLTESQYSSYSYDLMPPSSIYSTSGSTGDFSFDASASGKTYIAFDHGDGYENIAQSVSVNLNAKGAVDLIFLIPGIALVIIGIVAMIVGKRMEKKDTVSRSNIPQSTDVTFFDRGQPPKRV